MEHPHFLLSQTLEDEANKGFFDRNAGMTVPNPAKPDEVAGIRVNTVMLRSPCTGKLLGRVWSANNALSPAYKQKLLGCIDKLFFNKGAFGVLDGARPIDERGVAAAFACEANPMSVR